VWPCALVYITRYFDSQQIVYKAAAPGEPRAKQSLDGQGLTVIRITRSEEQRDCYN
jgi:hypothetical protein